MTEAPPALSVVGIIKQNNKRKNLWNPRHPCTGFFDQFISERCYSEKLSLQEGKVPSDGNRYNQNMPKELQIPTEIDLAAFISKEAHDLKSPFNRALGFLKLVLKGMDGPISEQANEDLTIAYQNAQYTLTMMSALVDIARLGRGERSLTPASHSVEYILQQAISEWQRKYHKENPVEIIFSTPAVQILADEIMIRQCFSNWISFVNEFVQEAVIVNIQVEEQPETCLFTVRSSGKKLQPPPECDLTMYGFVAKGILDLHHGELIHLEEDEQGAFVQFSLPMT